MSEMWPRADGGDLEDEPQVIPKTMLALKGSFSLRRKFRPAQAI